MSKHESGKCINEYDYAGFGYNNPIEISNLFPKSEKEKEEKEQWENATLLEKLEIKEFDYQVGDKQANLKCHELVKKICKLIFSDKKINKERIEKLIKNGIKEVAEISPIVEDKESVRAIENVINEALKQNEYLIKVDTY